MSHSNQYDFLIVGAGIVGLSVAKELSDRFPTAKIALLEKERKIGLHASGRNSGVLHSGIYYPTSSIKATVCREGAERMKLFAEKHHITCKPVGKIIIARSEHDLPVIDNLLQNAKNNHIQAYRLDEKEIKKIEPYASPYRYGIYTPDTGSIDSKAVLDKLQSILHSKGITIHFEQDVIAADAKKSYVVTAKSKFHFGYLFNCAGTGTDIIAKMFGLANDFRLLPFKGIYYKLSKEKNYLVNGNIYPVPDLKLPFLGVHFTRSMDGEIYVGPTAIPAFGRENYGVIQGLNLEIFRIMKDLTLMYITNPQNFRRLMHSEIKKYIKHYFSLEARTLVSSLKSNDLLTSEKVGIRPQLINVRQRKLVMDYIIEQGANSMHVLNAISPAFTGSFRFAELLVDRMQK